MGVFIWVDVNVIMLYPPNILVEAKGINNLRNIGFKFELLGTLSNHNSSYNFYILKLLLFQ